MCHCGSLDKSEMFSDAIIFVPCSRANDEIHCKQTIVLSAWTWSTGTLSNVFQVKAEADGILDQWRTIIESMLRKIWSETNGIGTVPGERYWNTQQRDVTAEKCATT